MYSQIFTMAMNSTRYHDHYTVEPSKADTIGTNKIVHYRGCTLVRGLLYIMWVIFGFSKCSL